MRQAARYLVPAALLGSGIAAILLGAPQCETLAAPVPTPGSHGYRTWYSSRLVSAPHAGGRICIPEGWSAAGAAQSGDGWAAYAPGATAVMIRDDSFETRVLGFSRSSYVVELRFPRKTPPETLAAYERIVRNAFERVGSLFNDSADAPARPHAVVVTAGLGLRMDEDGSVYPDPGPSVSYLILSPDDPRAEELFIHAIAHLYNRFGGARLAYQEYQSPLPAGDFEELEASWTETAFRAGAAERRERVELLAAIHEAVMRGRAYPPSPLFGDAATVAAMRRRVAADPEGSYAEHQYGHYVLAPLVMVGIDGLLAERGAAVTVEELLTRLHAGEYGRFFGELQAHLPAEDAARVLRWVAGEEAIPRETILAGLSAYD